MFYYRCSINLMSVSEDSTITMLKEITTTFKCDSISLLDVDTFMVGTYDHRPPIRTIDVDGNEGEVQHKLLPDKPYKFYKSACTYLPSTKTILFTDIEQHTVYMCDIKSERGRVITHDKIRAPRGMCAVANGNVFVCSKKTHSIVEVSLRGDVLMAHDVGMYLPCAISVSTDGSRLVVANSARGQRKIKLFNIV